MNHTQKKIMNRLVPPSPHQKHNDGILSFMDGAQSTGYILPRLQYLLPFRGQGVLQQEGGNGRIYLSPSHKYCLGSHSM